MSTKTWKVEAKQEGSVKASVSCNTREAAIAYEEKLALLFPEAGIYINGRWLGTGPRQFGQITK